MSPKDRQEIINICKARKIPYVGGKKEPYNF